MVKTTAESGPVFVKCAFSDDFRFVRDTKKIFVGLIYQSLIVLTAFGDCDSEKYRRYFCKYCNYCITLFVA